MNIKRTKKNILSLAMLVYLVVSPSLAQSKSYKGAITAKELLVLMTACDLLSPTKKYGRPVETLSQMCDQGKQLLKLGMSSIDSGSWIWQPDKMIDHNDFKYAGNAKIAPGLKEKKVPGISMDSAHFYAKWPLFFLSARNASSNNEKDFFDKAIEGMINNLFTNVVKFSDKECVIRFNNYIDGTNGVYRWNWQMRGEKYGHSEYGLSYTPFFSSLALLDSARISELYRTILGCYPYSQEEKKKYFWSRGLEEERLLIELSETQPRYISRGEDPSESEQVYYKQYFSKRISVDKEITSKDAYASVVGDRMLIMHYAFHMDYDPWLQDFHRYADKASQLLCVDCIDNITFYEELHLLYFLGKYLNLNSEFNHKDIMKYKSVFEKILNRVSDLYINNQPEEVSIYGWDGVRIYNFKDYVEWKLLYYRNSKDET